MTAQDFRLIASTINGIRCRAGETITPTYIAVAFADRLAQLNPGFKMDLFLSACGVSPEERATLKK